METFANSELESGIINARGSHICLGLNTAHGEMDSGSFQGPQTQDAILSPLLSKGKFLFVATMKMLFWSTDNAFKRRIKPDAQT